MRKSRDEEFDRLVASDPALEAVVERVRQAFKAGPSEQTRRTHLAVAMSVTIRPAAGPRPAVAPRRRRTRLAAAAVVGATFAFGGLAYAGALPDAMQDALSNAAAKAGFTLPASEAHRNQNAVESGQDGDHGKSVSEDVDNVLDQDFETGKEKGDAVSDAADQNRRSEGNQGNPSTSNPTHTVTDPKPDHGKGPPSE